MRDEFAAPRRSSPAQDLARYLHRRRTVFLVAYLGYAACYLVRNNVAVASDVLAAEHGWSASQIGSILAGFTLSYGIGKLVMGVAVDRFSLRHSFAWGLGASALVCIAMTFLHHPLALTLALVLIGLLQGACAPAALATLAAWYPARTRGSRVAVWNTSRNVGGAGLPLLVSGGLALTGPTNWQIAFWMPGVVALVVAVWADRRGGDRPWQEGLPTLRDLSREQDRAGHPSDAGEAPRPDVSYWDLVRVHVLANPDLLLLMVLNALMYVLRFGILNWIPLYLTWERGLTRFEAAGVMSLFEWGAIPGALIFAVAAWRRPRGTSGVAAWCMVALGALIPLYLVVEGGTRIGAVVFVLGMLVYGPQVVVNILTLAFVHPRAVGVAVGWVGLGGYLVGALLANLAVPQIAEALGWNVGFGTLTAVALVCAWLCARLQRIEHGAAPPVA